ncbi:hypothetical protein ABZ642_41975 [Streptomyces sp. NPDC007157]|uniref:hypothetical protein n=1 Tax=Streptomyces sp. NPDC007157 TaxID=3154681 RepID=UPI0033F7DC8B
MSDDDRRQSPPANNGLVVNGGTHQVANIPAGGAPAPTFSSPMSSRPRDDSPAARTAQLLALVERLLEEYQAALPNPAASIGVLLHLRLEITEAAPQLTVIHLLEQLYATIEPVPQLAMAVTWLRQSVVDLLHQRASDFESPRSSLTPGWRPSADSRAGERPTSRSPEPEASPLPVTIYLSDEAPHREVQAAVEELLATAGLTVLDREDPVIGSWFRRMRATLSRALWSQAVREGVLTAAHIADARLTQEKDAAITATMMQNVGPLLASLQPTKDAVVRIGAVLIVKVDWEVRVLQLTAPQQAILDHQPQLATTPRDVIGALGLLAASDGRTAPEPAPRTAADR